MTVRFSLTLLLSFAFFAAFSQWTIYRVPQIRPTTSARPEQNARRPTGKRITYREARLDSILLPDGDSGIADTVHIPPAYLAPHGLPFFDDFSHSTTTDFADSTGWQWARAVSRNSGLGIFPPSIGVVSFDGLDSLGAPYDPVNALDKGYGDRLTSWTFKLDSVPEDQKDSIYLSFFFEFQGNGEPPDPGDHLLVEYRAYKKDSLNWISVGEVDVIPNFLIRGVGNTQDTVPLSDTTFYSMIIKVPQKLFDSDPDYFHDQFQFRISSFGRVSGPWDTWNIDYVYLNYHRFATDISINDRTIYSPLTSLFGKYWSVPASHFHADSTKLIVHPTFAITNLRADQRGNVGQVVRYNSNVKIDEWKDGQSTDSKTLVLDTNHDLDTIPHQQTTVTYQEHRVVALQTLPEVSDFTPDSDSIHFTMEVQFLSGDGIPYNQSLGDYLPKYVPIDFHVNDTTRIRQTMSNYYAYDDGTAEFAAGLNQPGTEVAVRFDMIQKQVDYLQEIDFYFPNVGDQSAQTIILVVRKDTTDFGTIYSEVINLQRSAFNKFVRHVLNRPIRVQDYFYIGYRQTSTGVIALGLDESHNTTGNVVFNVQGFWENADSTGLQGSVMIRPVFKTPAVISGLDAEPVALDVFPNPSTGTFYLSKRPDQLEVIDFTGRRLDFLQDSNGDHFKIMLQQAPSGVYLLRASVQGQQVTRRVLVQR